MDSELSTQLHRSLDDPCLYHTTTQQRRDKGIIVEGLQKPLREEKHEKAGEQVITDRDEQTDRFGSEDFTSSLTHHTDFQSVIKEKTTSEQRSILEEECDQSRNNLEDRPRTLRVGVTEERNRHASTKRLPSSPADYSAQDALTTGLEPKTISKVEEELRQLRSSHHKLEGVLFFCFFVCLFVCLFVFWSFFLIYSD